MKYIYRHINTPLITLIIIYYGIYVLFDYTKLIGNGGHLVLHIISIMLMILIPFVLTLFSVANEISLYGGTKIVSKHNVYIWKIKIVDEKAQLHIYKCSLLYNIHLRAWDIKNPHQIDIMNTIQNYIATEDKNIDAKYKLKKDIKYMKEEMQNWKGL